MKIIRKAGTAVMTTALLLGSVTPVMADKAVPSTSPASTVNSNSVQGKEQLDLTQVEPKITKDKAIQLAKGYIPQPEGYTLQSANLYVNNGPDGKQRKTWNLEYSLKKNKESLGYMNYSLDADSGSLLGYNFYDNNPDRKPSYPPKTDLNLAKSIAVDYITKLSPDLQKQVKYNDLREASYKVPLNGLISYPFGFERVVDGVPFPQNGIQIQIDGEGRLTEYRVNWKEDIKFDKNEGVIAQEKAAKALNEASEPLLQYVIPYQMKERKPVIAYTMAAIQIDAKTGKPVLQSGTVKPADLQTLTEKPQPSSGPIANKEAALKRVQALIQIPANAKLEEASYGENNNEETKQSESTWNFRWSLQDEEGDNNGAISLALNANNGELNYLSQYNNSVRNPFKASDVKVSYAEAKAKAIEFVKKTIPGSTHQLVLDESSEPEVDPKATEIPREYSFNFSRYIDGVRVETDQVAVSVDKGTGVISNMYKNINTLPFPDKKPEVLGTDKAKEKLLSQYQLRLIYQTSMGEIPQGIPIEKYKLMIAAGDIGAIDEMSKNASLVYTLENKYSRQQYFLDAVTGQWRNRENGEVISLEPIKVSDIAGHWAQNELQLMLDYQALEVKDGKVNPDQSIKRGELIKMLVLADSGGGYYPTAAMKDRANSFADVTSSNEYFSYVETALDRKWIDRNSEEFNPDQPITREEMASLIVRALNYKKLTEYEAIFSRNFTDAADIKNIGTAAIVTGMGIMSAENGKFNSKAEVTRAQAATAFYRFLQKRY
ncbi:S-layer homology domain-containing protein [Paenibacillus sp. FJAT-26967]|uniref:S-layer homology domain-containing protein n=1 Tax=Paenibacillus sp. FJAT-26967 TaxID=1729690 RepID=UPI0008383433|nr:S-layer homology domain-containing protein [Paenibacillus sp. FJAT-26967]